MTAAKRRLLACVLGSAAGLSALWLLLAVTASASPPAPDAPALVAVSAPAGDLNGASAANDPVLRIDFKKTVGVAPQCSAFTSTEIAVLVGTPVRYCYTVYNTGNVTVSRHSLVDSQLSQLLNDYPYTLTPGNGAQFSIVITPGASVINTATWTAYNPGPVDVVSDTASATVTVLSPAMLIPLILN